MVTSVGTGGGVKCRVCGVVFFSQWAKTIKIFKKPRVEDCYTSKVSSFASFAPPPQSCLSPSIYKRCSFCWGVSVWGRRVTPGFSKKTQLWSSVKTPLFDTPNVNGTFTYYMNGLIFFGGKCRWIFQFYSEHLVKRMSSTIMTPIYFFLNKRRMWWLKKGEVHQPIYTPIQRVYPNFQGKFTQFPGSKIQNYSLIW